MRTSIITIIALVALFSFSAEGYTIIFRADKSTHFDLMGFSVFEEMVIQNVEIDSGKAIEINTDYQGLALIKYENLIQYPLIISQETIKIDLQQPEIPPYFENSPENEFLYNWLSSYRQLQRDMMMLEEKKSSPDSIEYDKAETEAEISNIEDQLKEQESILSTPEYPFAKILLKARLLNESTYGIKTIDELDARRESYYQFSEENFESLKNSDMLMELIKQYFMMHEYVSYVEEGSQDIKGAKRRYHDYVISGVDAWLEVLGARMEPQTVIEFCANLYYLRSMVSQATQIFNQYRKLLMENGQAGETPLLELEEQFPNLEYRNADLGIRDNLSNLRTNKVIMIISDRSLFSKVEAIGLARSLGDNDEGVPVIIAPVEKLSNSHLLMDRMCTKDLYFFKDNEWQKEYLSEETSLPQFILLDGDNTVIKISKNKNEIITALGK